MQNEQKTKKKQIGSKQRTDLDERRFSEVRDLLQLTFSLDGKHEVDVYSATPAQMSALATALANVDNVDESTWPIGDRLDFVNQLWQFCQMHNFSFPLKIRSGQSQDAEPDEQGNTSNLA